MTVDASDCNGSGGVEAPPAAEHEAKGDLGMGPAGDLGKPNGAASPDGGNENEFVIVSGDLDDLSEKGFGQREKVDLVNGDENGGPLPVNAGSAVGVEAAGNHEDIGGASEGGLAGEHGLGNRPSHAEGGEPLLHSETQIANCSGELPAAPAAELEEGVWENREETAEAGELGEGQCGNGGLSEVKEEDLQNDEEQKEIILDDEGGNFTTAKVGADEGGDVGVSAELGESKKPDTEISTRVEEKQEIGEEVGIKVKEGLTIGEMEEPANDAIESNLLVEPEAADGVEGGRVQEIVVGEDNHDLFFLGRSGTAEENHQSSLSSDPDKHGQEESVPVHVNAELETAVADREIGDQQQLGSAAEVEPEDSRNTDVDPSDVGQLQPISESGESQKFEGAAINAPVSSSLPGSQDELRSLNLVDDDEKVDVSGNLGTSLEFKTEGDGEAEESVGSHGKHGLCSVSVAGNSESSDILLDPAKQDNPADHVESPHAGSSDNTGPSETSSSANIPDNSEQESVRTVACTPGDRQVVEESVGSPCNNGQVGESVGSHGNHGLCTATVAGNSASSDILLEPAKEGNPADHVEALHARSSVDTCPSETCSSANLPDNSEEESVRTVACTPGDEQVVEESVGSPCHHEQAEDSVASHDNHGLLLDTATEGKQADQVEFLHVGSSVNTGPSEISSSANIPDSSEEDSVRIVACAPGHAQVVDEAEAPCPVYESYLLNHVSEDTDSQNASSSIEASVETETRCVEGVEILRVAVHDTSAMESKVCDDKEVNQKDAAENLHSTELECRSPHDTVEIGQCSIQEGGEPTPVSARYASAMESKVYDDKDANQEDAAENLPFKLESRAPHGTVEICKCSIQEGEEPTPKTVSAHDASAMESKVCDDKLPSTELESGAPHDTPKLDSELAPRDTEEADEAQATLEDSSMPNLDADKVDTQMLKRQPCYIIKIPRFASEKIWARKQDAELQLDEKTQRRDSIQILIKKKKVACDDSRQQLNAAKADEKAAKDLCNAKRQEINSVQSIINKLNKATTIEEIAEKIAMKERSLQHETLSLKQEKLFIQEIKELKAQQKQLCSNVGSKAEMDEAFDQRDQVYERLRNLKREQVLLGSNLATLEGITKVAQSNYDDEREELRKLQDQFRAADEVRQKAYEHWRDLKTESIKKSKYFFMYKDDQKVVSKYLSSGDKKGLWSYCNNQIERVMELWNTNDEFREQYVESNKNSTLRRFKTLDGRSLGPDEDPPIVYTNTNKRSNTVAPNLTSTSLAPAVAAKAELVSEKDPFPALQPSKITQHGNPNLPVKEGVEEVNSGGKDKADDMENEGAELERKAELLQREEESRKKAELLEREEELRKKAEAEKEWLRLEQRAKALEAEERKRRKAEKAQERAKYKARKEAEIRDKKKAKKEKKKAAGTSDTADGIEAGSDLSTDNSMPETNREPETPAATASTKRHSRTVIPAKQLNRVQPVPLPLRNRGRRKMHKWMMIGAYAVLAAALIVGFGYVFFFGSGWFSSQI